MCIVDVGSFEVLSDHGDTTEDTVVFDESSECTGTGTVTTCLLVQGDKDIKARRNTLRDHILT